jgi:hypothetical protein
MPSRVIRTDQVDCYNSAGDVIPCLSSLQDGALRAGAAWPQPRFSDRGDTVVDHLTGLMWTKDASVTEFPFMWWEALAFINDMNSNCAYGYSDWRLPNRKELFSLVSHTKTNPSLPAGHPFVHVFSGYYWTSTTCSRLHREAWYVHLGGARLFKGMKHGSYMVWPVRSEEKGVVELPRSGQQLCYDETQEVISCIGSGQDGALQIGFEWPEPRFAGHDRTVLDRLTGLMWTKKANCTSMEVNWKTALETVKAMNADRVYGYGDWRLPNIRELESLTDMGSHSPALSSGHSFKAVQKYYWSSTTSTYDPCYAWALYIEDGAVGVGYKPNSSFFVWAVRDG